MVDLINTIRRRVEADELALGFVVRLARTGDVVRIAKSSGFDFLFIDGQHAIFSIETIGHIAQAALGCGITALVRVKSCTDPDVALLLDGGVGGIVFPDVNTVEEARLAVSRCKLPPIGRRAVVGSYPHFDFKPVPIADATATLNTWTTVVCMIETAEGLSNLDQIAAVEGVDVILVGLNDLLADLGRPGAYGDPVAIDAVLRVIAAATAHGKIAGLGGNGDPARLATYVEAGLRFLLAPSDAGLLMKAASQAASELRGLKRATVDKG